MMDETSDDAQTDDATGAEVQDAAADDAEQALALLDRLRVEHRRIDQEIDALSETGVADMLKLRRMKKNQTLAQGPDPLSGKPDDAGHHRVVGGRETGPGAGKASPTSC